jgi:hypothetical protein
MMLEPNSGESGDVPRQPPLWSWLAALGMAVLILAGLLVWDRVAQRSYFHFDRLGPEAAGLREDLVVAIGTSKTRCALDFDSDMTALMQAAGLPQHFVRITHSAGTMDDLETAFEQLEQTPPKLLAVEADLLLYEPQVYRPFAGPYQAPDVRQHIRQNVTELVGDTYRRLIGAQPEYSIFLENTPVSRSGCTPLGERKLADYLALLATRRASTAAERQRFLDHFARLRALGVTIVLLDLPRAPAALQGFPPALAKAAATARESVRQTGWVGEVGQPPLLEARYFLDPGHLTAAGRQQFSTWFVQQLRPLLMVKTGD